MQLARVEEVLLETAYDGGEIATADYLRRFGEGLGADVDEAGWIEARVAACEADPRVLEMVARVAERLPVAVLTNNGPLMAEAITRIVPSLSPLLDGRVLCSGALGGRKPNTRSTGARWNGWRRGRRGRRRRCSSTTCSPTCAARARPGCMPTPSAGRRRCGGCSGASG
ncbi:MAG: hypothetical protein QM581_05840 [Pseudomonas sp.]